MENKVSVGDYVRTKNGEIHKIKSVNDEYIKYENGYGIPTDLEKNYSLKSSKDIIDLIEVGDYVNGKQVLDIWTEPFGELFGMTLIELYGEKTIPTIRNIKSILTHEQFEANAYKIEKEV